MISDEFKTSVDLEYSTSVEEISENSKKDLDTGEELDENSKCREEMER